MDGKAIKKEREKRGITQQDLSDDSGVLQSTIAQLENGKIYPTFGTLKKLSKALNKKIVLLVSSEDVKMKLR